MQRPATIRHRTSLYEDATAIVAVEYADELGLDDIARRVASSRRQLQRAYAEIGDTTFREHLTAVRMDRAAEMLTTRGLTVREVAHRVGYRQPAQFAKAFRRRHGVAPSTSGPARRRARQRASESPCAPAQPPEPIGARERHRAGRYVGALRSSRRTHRIPPRCGSRRACRHGASAGGPWVRWLRGRHRVGPRDHPGTEHPLVPAGGLDPGRQDRHPLGRPDRRLGPGLRAGDRRGAVRVPGVPHARRRREPRRPADPRQHAPGDHLDRDPGDPDRWRSWATPTASCTTSRRHRPASAGARRHVTGQQFAWTFQYKEGGKTFAADTLYLPAGQSVKFDVESKDVIHDFWVPDFRMKIDAVPGITTSYRVTPKDSGIGYHGSSARSSAASATPSCARPRTSSRARRLRQVDAEASSGGAAAAGRGRRQSAGGGKADGKPLFAAGNADRRHGLRVLPHAR